jgi:hypothetical protein
MVNLSQNTMSAMGMTHAIGPGVGGTFSVMGMTGTTVDVSGHPWTVNTAMANWVKNKVGTVTLKSTGFVCGPAGLTTMGFDCANNANGTTLGNAGMGGMVQLVTPVQTTCVGEICNGNSPSAQISRLTLTFQPEPGRLAMLAAGAAALMVLGRTRARR